MPQLQVQLPQTPQPEGTRAIIVGGGLSGMAVAVALESVGVDVTLIEARRSLGGRATSFVDPHTGIEIDNCQHVLLGCCTNLLSFYDKIDARQHIAFERTIRFRDDFGKHFGLKATPGVPAPAHLSLSFSRFGILTLKEKTAYARAMLAMLRLGRAGRKKLAEVSFGKWLAEHNQPDSLIKKMYDPVLIGALNEDCKICSAEYAIQVFQDAMLADAQGYVMGIATCPLSQLYGSFKCHDLRLGTRVSEILFSHGAASGVRLNTGEELLADVVVLATNHHAVQKWVPTELAATDSRFTGLNQLQSVPILGAYMEFDRSVLLESHAAFTSGPLQWIFGKNATGSIVSGVISAAREWVSKPHEHALAEFAGQITRILPEARGAKLLRGTIVIEKRATFAPLPGIDRLRPEQAPPVGGIANLFLAGDYTRTGWPATMEGAVRGGYLAADAVARFANAKSFAGTFLKPDLSAQWPARLLGL